MNGALLKPDEFHGRNPLAAKPRKIPWQALVGDEHLEEAWSGHPLGLNVPVPTPVQKGDAYRSGTHYKSKFDPMVAPTGGTIGLGGCTAPGVININGSAERSLLPAKAVGVIGKKLGSYKANAQQFLTCHEKHPPLAFPTRFHYPDQLTVRHHNRHHPSCHRLPSGDISHSGSSRGHVCHGATAAANHGRCLSRGSSGTRSGRRRTAKSCEEMRWRKCTRRQTLLSRIK